MKKQVYILDDDDSVRGALKRLIRSAGIEVRSFSSAKELLDFEGIDDNACLVVDIMMPGMGGLELCDELQTRGYDLPVILISGLDSQATRSVAKNAGAAGYFRKPIDDQALLDSIDWALTKKTSKRK